MYFHLVSIDRSEFSVANENSRHAVYSILDTWHGMKFAQYMLNYSMNMCELAEKL